MTKLVVVGMGYVGIPAAALFADVENFEVVGIQRRSIRSGWKIDWLNAGKCPIGGDEPGLAELIARVVAKKTFRVTDDYAECLTADVILIDVQTPTDGHNVPRYESLKTACTAIGRHLTQGSLVILESTVAPGTTEHVVKPILERESSMKAGMDFGFAFSYERVMVGRLLHNITHYPRIIGGIDAESTDRAMALYANIVKAGLYITDLLTAEVAKVVENAYRDVNIAFANEMALLSESLGVNVFEIRELVNNLPNDPSNPSTNPVRNMHLPGAGVGGHCLPKDSWLLKYGADTYGKYAIEPNLIVRSRELNDMMPAHIYDLLEEGLEEAGAKMRGSKIAVLGVAFIENSDDTRNTPTKPLYDALVLGGALAVLHDPYVRSFELPFTNDLEAATAGADAIAIMVNHQPYANMYLPRVKLKMRTPVIVDSRNAFDKAICEQIGFVYKGLGKPR